VTFGMYDTVNIIDNESIGQMSYSCEGTIAGISIHFSKGNAGDFQRFMLSPEGDKLFYNLYIDAARQQILGDGTGGSFAYNNGNITSGVPIMIPVYGKISARQDIGVGTYTDHIIITIQF
jgi:spore coat protein U-like protein